MKDNRETINQQSNIINDLKDQLLKKTELQSQLLKESIIDKNYSELIESYKQQNQLLQQKVS